MESQDAIFSFLTAFKKSIEQNNFVSLTLGNYKGADETIKNIYIKKILIKKEEKLNFTYRYKTNDIVKNYSFTEASEKIQEQIAGGFRSATLFTTQNDWIFDNSNSEKFIIKQIPPTKTVLPSLQHDEQKKRAISATGKQYLTELKITDAAGNVFKATQDKYKQINHYIDVLSSMIKELPKKETLKVVDMGAGKGYLTFALYDYISNVLKISTAITGVEFRPDLVRLCNDIAKKSAFTQLDFVEGTIESFETNETDILIALHACDTATDDAIAKGISSNASLIVVAPCCHKQIRREMEKHKVQNEISFITQHGIFMERQAEMATDAIRALVLEYYGYKVKVFEFITDAHTPKNIMIAAVKQKNASTGSKDLSEKIKSSMKYLGIKEHYLVKTLDLQEHLK